jgi:hypothetical protein
MSEPGPLIRAGPARARIEPGRAGLGPGLNNGLRAGLAGLVLIGHLYCWGVWNSGSGRMSLLQSSVSHATGT